MNINTKKAHALFLYNDKMAEILSQNENAFSSKSVAVKRVVAMRGGVTERTVSGYSVVGLVLPKGEEQISGPSAL